MAVGAAAADGSAFAVSAVAHSLQNFAPAAFDVPQFGQARARGVAHSVQNFAVGGFSVRQLAQMRFTGFSGWATGREA
jgi:hypothetical protein